MLKVLHLFQGAQFNFGDYDGRTVLHVACCEGHLDMIRFLLSSSTRPSVHVRDRYGHTPLDDAIRFNRHDVIKLLRETGAHLNLFPAKLGMMLCQYVSTLSCWVNLLKFSATQSCVSLPLPTTLQVAENYSYLFYLSTNICKSWCLNTHFIPNNSDLVD